MFDSILEDIRYAIRSGNMLTRIILVNITVFVVLNLLYVFTYFGDQSAVYNFFYSILALPSSFDKLLVRFWTFVTYMFTHKGMFHLLWNMLLLYWFGRIVGDLLGDKRVLPLYLLGGLAGAVVFLLADAWLISGTAGHSSLIGASAAVMCLMATAAATSPDYTMRLILLGPVKIKWIVLVLIFLDVLGTAGGNNAGGSFAHLGGAFFGLAYVYALRQGRDLTTWLQRLFAKAESVNVPTFAPAKTPKQEAPKPSNLKVVHKAKPTNIGNSNQEKMDAILDKIKQSGYTSLSEEEKAFLNEMSHKI